MRYNEDIQNFPRGVTYWTPGITNQKDREREALSLLINPTQSIYDFVLSKLDYDCAYLFRQLCYRTIIIKQTTYELPTSKQQKAEICKLTFLEQHTRKIKNDYFLYSREAKSIGNAKRVRILCEEHHFFLLYFWSFFFINFYQSFRL